MPRSPNTDSRRTQIVAALLPVLAQHGYEKATIVAIARQAGLTPGLIHYHFATKRDILVSLVLSIVEYANGRFAESARGATDPMQRLESYIDSRVGLGEGANAELAAAWVMIGAEAVRQPEVRDVYEQAVAAELQGLSALLRACLDERNRDSTGATRIAAALMAMMEGAFQLSSAAGKVMPAGYAAESAREYARLVIEGAPPRAGKAGRKSSRG